MSLVTISDLSIRFRGPVLLDRVNFRVMRGQRIGLLGRNGAGKSTLMKILSGQVEPDDGEVAWAPTARAALLPQEVPLGVEGTISEVVAAGLPSGDETHESPWRDEQRVERILSRMELEAQTPFEQLSSGMKRRTLLARTLVAQPDLLLLDEPTNHLDIDAIVWLEAFLDRWDGALMFVTHDRAFLRKLAVRILELDRGRLFDWSCDYDTFLQRKEAALAVEEKQNALFDKRLAQEETWIRQGILARRTRNEGRVRALQHMRVERQQRQSATGKVRLELHQQVRSGNLVVNAKKISFAYDQRPIFHDFSTTIIRGDKIGVIGPNGAGKTTLLRTLLGQLPPTQGTVRLGTNLQIAYFDQLRGQLDEDQSVQDNVADGHSTVNVGGKSKHIIGYLQDFLFTPERARLPVRFLSGGERNRVLLARLFAKPANVVVLDEPTNDLDTETLELLEELLVEYTGTVLLVSHDRAFLNNVVTGTIVFEGDRVKEYAGGYDDWLRQRATAEVAGSKDEKDKREGGDGKRAGGRGRAPEGESAASPRRLTYKEKQELASLPAAIEQMEAEIERRHAEMAAPEFFKRPGDEIARETTALNELKEQLAETYERWEELESRAG